jgi:hypothetical protein
VLGCGLYALCIILFVLQLFIPEQVSFQIIKKQKRPTFYG